MNAKRIGTALALVALVLLGFFGVQRFFSQRTFEVKGRVVGFGNDGQTVIIEHEEIPGYMPSMTMPFRAREAKETEGLNIGDPIAFKFVVTRERSWIENIRKIPEEELSLTKAEALDVEIPGGIKPLKSGEKVPPDITLYDQEGRTFTLGDLRGKTVVMTFIYTRCPLPEYCPLMTQRFKEMQPVFEREFGDNVRLLSVSFDTKNDTPKALKTYAELQGALKDNWIFASSTPEEMGRLTGLFNVLYVARNNEFIHNLVTVVIDPEGRVVKQWRGNKWDSDDVIEVVRSLY